MSSNQHEVLHTEAFTQPVHLIGASASNSLVAAELIKLGFRRIHIWDPYIVRPEDYSNNLIYSQRAINQPRVAAMVDTLLHLTGNTPINFDSPYHPSYHDYPEQQYDCGLHFFYAHFGRVTEDTELSGIVINGVTEKPDRLAIWSAIQNNDDKIPLYIDGYHLDKRTVVFAFSSANSEAVENYKSARLAYTSETDLTDTIPTSLHLAADIITAIQGYLQDGTINFRVSYGH